MVTQSTTAHHNKDQYICVRLLSGEAKLNEAVMNVSKGSVTSVVVLVVRDDDIVCHTSK